MATHNDKTSVVDSDPHFIVDLITRKVISNTDKSDLVQFDHNSERITFECPRYIEGHDTLNCNKVVINYLDDDLPGVYEVDDLKMKDSDTVMFSWLISSNATQKTGKIFFAITFMCVQTNGDVTYRWNTAINEGLKVIEGMNQNSTIVYDNVDILEQWKQQLFGTSDGEISKIQEATNEMLESIPSDYSDLDAQVKTNASSIEQLKEDLKNAELKDGDITTAKLADSSVTTAKLADKSITVEKLDESVTSEIANNQFTNLEDSEIMRAIDYDATKPFEIVNGYAFFDPLQFNAASTSCFDYDGTPMSTNENGSDAFRLGVKASALFFERDVADTPLFYLDNTTKKSITVDTENLYTKYTQKTDGYYYAKYNSSGTIYALMIPHNLFSKYTKIYDWAHATFGRIGIKLIENLSTYDPKEVITNGTTIYIKEDMIIDETEYYVGFLNVTADDVTKSKLLLSDKLGFCAANDNINQELIWFTATGARLNYRIKKQNISDHTADAVKDYLNSLEMAMYYIQ